MDGGGDATRARPERVALDEQQRDDEQRADRARWGARRATTTRRVDGSWNRSRSVRDDNPRCGCGLESGHLRIWSSVLLQQFPTRNGACDKSTASQLALPGGVVINQTRHRRFLLCIGAFPCNKCFLCVAEWTIIACAFACDGGAVDVEVSDGELHNKNPPVSGLWPWWWVVLHVTSVRTLQWVAGGIKTVTPGGWR